MTWLKSSKGQRNLNFLLSRPCSLHGRDSFCVSSQEFLHLCRCTCTHTITQPLTAETHGAEGQKHGRPSHVYTHPLLHLPACTWEHASPHCTYTFSWVVTEHAAVRPVPPPMLIWTCPMICETRQHCSRHRCEPIGSSSLESCEAVNAHGRGRADCQMLPRRPTPAASSALGTTSQRWQPALSFALTSNFSFIMRLRYVCVHVHIRTHAALSLSIPWVCIDTYLCVHIRE